MRGDLLAVRNGKRVRVIRDGAVVCEVAHADVPRMLKDRTVDERVRVALREVV